MIFIILIILIILVFGVITFRRENFASNLTIVDPYSLYLHQNIMEKADWWDQTHSRKLYYYHDMVPQHYKE